MTKQHSVVAATLAAACIVVAVAAGEQDPGNRFAGVELTTVPVAGNVHMVQGRGGGNARSEDLASSIACPMSSTGEAGILAPVSLSTADSTVC